MTKRESLFLQKALAASAQTQERRDNFPLRQKDKITFGRKEYLGLKMTLYLFEPCWSRITEHWPLIGSKGGLLNNQQDQVQIPKSVGLTGGATRVKNLCQTVVHTQLQKGEQSSHIEMPWVEVAGLLIPNMPAKSDDTPYIKSTWYVSAP